MSASQTKTGIFGGTFNPVHNGHVAAAKSFLASGVISELWILLNPSPPHKQGETFAPYASRLAMLEEAFGATDGMLISDLETTLPAPNYTSQTLTYLSETYPGRSFYLCIGKDSFLSFKDWHAWQTIIAGSDLLVADRPTDQAADQHDDVRRHAKFIDHQPVDISSTDIRKRVAAGRSIDDLVPPGVAEIIGKENLYR